MSKEKEDRCIELLENLLAKYPESLEELLDFLINAEQFYRENKEYDTRLLSEVGIDNVEEKDSPVKESKIITMKAKYVGKAKPISYYIDEDNE